MGRPNRTISASKGTTGISHLAWLLQPTAEANPIISGTNALWGTDILNGNSPISGANRLWSGLNTVSFFATPYLENGINLGISWVGTKFDTAIANQVDWIGNIFDSSSFNGYSGLNYLDGLPKLSSSAMLNFQLHTYIEQAYNLDVSTNVNSAVFWSGRGNQELAATYASQTGKTILEWTPGGSYFEIFKFRSNIL